MPTSKGKRRKGNRKREGKKGMGGEGGKGKDDLHPTLFSGLAPDPPPRGRRPFTSIFSNTPLITHVKVLQHGVHLRSLDLFKFWGNKC